MTERIRQIGADLPGRRVIFKVTLPAGISGEIREVALWSSRNTLNSDDFLVRADSATELLWNNGTWDTGSRVGESTVRITAPASATVVASPQTFARDLSGYVAADKIVVAYEVLQNVASMALDIGADADNKFTYTINAPAIGYNLTAIDKSSFAAVGNPDWSAPTYLAVALTATAAGEGIARLDAVRVNPQSVRNEGVLVSRKVLPQEIIKERNAPLDIEFALDV